MRILSKLFPALLLFSLVACASNGTIEFKPLHWKGNLWAITGKTIIDPDGDFITVVINGTDVMSGILNKDNPVANLTGNYEDYDIHAKCEFTSGGKNAKHKCSVLVGGEFAGDFTF
jgi:hypothetical protein